jgi:mannose-6-phosphate isomerase-like protein (cupin superfamily)
MAADPATPPTAPGRPPLGFTCVQPSERAERASRWPGTWAQVICNHATPTERLVAAIVTVAPGAAVAMHHHRVETLEFVLSGAARVSDRHGNAVVVSAEAALYFPAGPAGAHAWEVVGNAPVQVLFVYSAPPGEDDGLTRGDGSEGASA